ncbi:MAG: guanylate kinase [Gammaproteobacteria bacterium]|nr:guanylate kinase [Gammaproteobacteria bacterium]
MAAAARTTTGKLFVLSAPSGAGKTTLTRALLAADPALRFSISFTTRQPRGSERDGHDYFFVDPARFAAMIAAGELLEHAAVFGQHYGTGRAQIEAHTRAGHNVLLDIDWQGARQVRQRMPASVLVFIMPPSLDELERRLRSRGTDTEEVIRRRLAEARAEMEHWPEFDYLVINDRWEEALAALRGILAGHGAACATTAPAVRQRAAAILAGA